MSNILALPGLVTGFVLVFLVVFVWWRRQIRITKEMERILDDVIKHTEKFQ